METPKWYNYNDIPCSGISMTRRGKNHETWLKGRSERNPENIGGKNRCFSSKFSIKPIHSLTHSSSGDIRKQGANIQEKSHIICHVYGGTVACKLIERICNWHLSIWEGYLVVKQSCECDKLCRLICIEPSTCIRRTVCKHPLWNLEEQILWETQNDF